MSMLTLLEVPGQTRRTRARLRGLAAITLAGGIAGFAVGGVGSRVAMRIAALAAGEPARGLTTEAGATVGRITVEGTLFLFLFAGIGATLVGTAFYLVLRPWLPRRRLAQAVAFGILELIVFGSTLLDASNADFSILGHPMLNVTLFGSLFVLHGFVLVMVLEPAGRFVSRFSRVRWRSRLVDLGAIVALGLTAIGVAAIGARTDGAARLEWVTLGVCAFGVTVIDPRRSRPITVPALRVVGAIALAIIALSGAWSFLDNVATIV